MSSNKRRQVMKNTTQTQIQFPQTKGGYDSHAQRQEFAKKFETQGYIYDYQSGAKDCQSTFRSVNRVNKMLKASPLVAQHGTGKLIEDYTKFSPQSVQFNMSKPSSATTACTYAPNEYSAIKNDLSSLMKQKRVQNSDRKKKLVGQKRPAQQKLEDMEYFINLSSRAAKFVANSLRLRNKKTGEVMEFRMMTEDHIKGFRNNSIVTSFDMSKLEVEYDYDTDCEQLTQSKKMLLRELIEAIDYFVKEEPLKLVDNISL